MWIILKWKLRRKPALLDPHRAMNNVQAAALWRRRGRFSVSDYYTGARLRLGWSEEVWASRTGLRTPARVQKRALQKRAVAMALAVILALELSLLLPQNRAMAQDFFRIIRDFVENAIVVTNDSAWSGENRPRERDGGAAHTPTMEDFSRVLCRPGAGYALTSTEAVATLGKDTLLCVWEKGACTVLLQYSMYGEEIPPVFFSVENASIQYEITTTGGLLFACEYAQADQTLAGIGIVNNTVVQVTVSGAGSKAQAEEAIKSLVFVYPRA